MRILFLCNKLPFPPVEGSPIAMNALISGLIDAGHNIKILAVRSSKFDFDKNQIPSEYIEKTRLESVYLDLDIKPLRLIGDLLKGKSYNLSRFENKTLDSRLIEILKEEEFDIVQLETLYMSPYIDTIRKHSEAKIVLRAHNIEHLIWQQLAVESFNPFKKMLMRKLALALFDYEKSIRSRVDAIACISPDDEAFFSTLDGKAPVRLIPFGIEPFGKAENFELPDKFPSLFHIGSMNWMPNEQGIKWFLRHVWPSVHNRYPDICLYLAGRQMPNWLKYLSQEGVVIEGEVADAEVFMAKHRIMIVPLFSGSGIRIKIIQGMLAGKAIISTRTGASGINYEQGKHLLTADDKEGFIRAIINCVENPGLCINLGKNARELALSDHYNPNIIQKLIGLYRELF